ncbi:Ig-like domain-containing protein, partial [Nanoarchaeota archaeon]
MNKAVITLITIVCFVLISSSAFAVLDVTYKFNQNDVTIYAYDCLDSSCSQTQAFSGEFTNGNTTTNGEVVVRFPSTKATPYDYALFFVSPGYRPYELLVSAHSNGDNNVYTANHDIEFAKIAMCRAQVSEFSVLNNIKPNIPVVVDISASLDSTTQSAFRKVDNGIGFIPQEIIDQFYSADTKVTLQIYKDGQLIDTITQEFTAENGNPIFADNSKRVEFTYLPRNTGSFSAVVTAEVIDPICSAQESASSSASFNVIPEEPKGDCYTILNDLNVNNQYPKTGEKITVTFSKISNYADNDGNLQALQTDVDVTVINPEGTKLINEQDYTFLANPDTINPTSQEFDFTPSKVGNFTITVTGTSNDIMCKDVDNFNSSVSMNFYVEDANRKRTVLVRVVNEEGDYVSSATVTLNNEEKSTDSKGKAAFELALGTYDYKVEKSDYYTKKGEVTVTGDQTVFVMLREENDAPDMDLPASITLISGETSTLMLGRYTSDEEKDLNYTFTSVAGLDIEINDRIAYITATAVASGTNEVTFTVTDSEGLSDSDTISVIVQSDLAPVFAELPSLTLEEDTHLRNALYLPAYVTDEHSEDLTFSLSVNDTRAGISITSNKFVEVAPSPDFNGVVTATITASDGTNNVSTDLIVNITPKADTPLLNMIPKITNISQGNNITINLTELFVDPDESNLTYTILNPNEDLTVILDETLGLLTLILGNDLHENVRFNITVTNEQGNNVTMENVVVDLTGVDDAPFFNSVIPDITIEEEGIMSLDLSPFENDQEDGPGGNNNSLTWSIGNVNASRLNVTLDEVQDYLIIEGVKDFFGVETLNFTLKDSQNKTTSQNVTVNVTNINDAPVFVDLVDKSIEAGTLFTYQVNATDADNDNLTFNSTNSTIPISATGLMNFTISDYGTHNTTLSVCDATNCTNATFKLIVTDTTKPDTGNYTYPAAPIVYDPNQTLTFGVVVNDNDGIDTVDFELNGIVVNDTNVTSVGNDTYEINLTDLSAGYYTYKWNIKDKAGNTNSSDVMNFTIEKANATMNLTLDGADSVVALAGDNVTVEINGSITTPANKTIRVLVNGVEIANGTGSLSTNYTFEGQGTTHNLTLQYAGDENYSLTEKTGTVTIMDSTDPVLSNITEGTTSGSAYSEDNYSFSVKAIDNIDVDSVWFTFNGNNYTNTTEVSDVWSVILSSPGVGDYTYQWFANDTTNNNVNTSIQNYSIVKADPVLAMSFSPSNNESYGTETSVSCSVNTDQFNTTLLRDGFTMSNPDVANLSAGTYNYTCTVPGNANYNASSMSQNLTVNKFVTLLSTTTDESPITYGFETNTSCSANHNVTINFERNGVTASNPDVDTLGAGVYNYTCNVTETQNYTGDNTWASLTIDK